MSDLVLLQREIAAAMLGSSAREPADIARGDIPQRVRWSVHRNNVRSSLRRTLETTFPATRAYMGNERFRGLADSFVRDEPPSCGWLSAYGGELSSYLGRAGADTAVAADIARVEWTCRSAARAPCDPSVELAALLRWPESERADVRLRLARGVFPLTVRRAALVAWIRFVGSEADAAEPLRPEEPVPFSDLLVVRTPTGVAVNPLAASDRACVERFRRGPVSVLELARAYESAPDLALALARLTRAGVIVR